MGLTATIGISLGRKDGQEYLYNLSARHPGFTDKASEAHLVLQAHGGAEYLLPS